MNPNKPQLKDSILTAIINCQTKGNPTGVLNIETVQEKTDIEKKLFDCPLPRIKRRKNDCAC